MTDQKIRFDDGAAYERMMGKWSHLVGGIFLDWLAPQSGLQWIDIGCGNGAFTELITARSAPLGIVGVDPSEGQLAFARARHVAKVANFHRGDATSLPFPNSSFDIAVMALVIFFVPDPVKGIAEMVRVVKSGGIVATYAWDIPGGGFPFEVIMEEMQACGLNPPRPPRAEVSSLNALRDLWIGAGLEEVQVREIAVTRSFDDYEDFWTSSLSGTAGQMINALAPADSERLKARVRERMPGDPGGRLTCAARASAAKGRVR